jgi:4-hydroxymandelate synthase
VTTQEDVALHGIELWVGDLGAVRMLLTTAFGFEPRVGAADDLDGALDDAEVAVLGCGDVVMVLRQGESPESTIARHVASHGDTVGDVALACADPGAVVRRALDHGLDVFGSEDHPTIDLTGERTVCHSVRGARPRQARGPGMAGGSGIRGIDHVAYCLPWGTAERAARVYEVVFGLGRVDVGDSEMVGGDDVGMRSIVLRSRLGFTVVLTEPTSEGGAGQTQRFVDAHAGPGVQHAAIACDDLIATVESLRSRGVEFLAVPGRYFDDAQRRLCDQPVPWEALRRLEILVDCDEQGLLFQLFTRPLAGRPTFFFELIQRAGATGFGVNNVRALFAAVQAAIAD